MPYELREAVEILERTPAVLRAWLGGLSPGWIHAGTAETFSPFDVVGHLITGERTDWMVRTRLILEHGASRPFEKYDRYAQFESGRGRTLEDLLDEFAGLRAANLSELAALGLGPADLARQGTHAALGTVTLGQLLATWCAHDLNHISQIAKAMATRYEHDVGPWRAYLGVLKHPPTRMDAEGTARKRAAGWHGGDTP